MKFDCIVFSSPTRNSSRIVVEAEDKTEAAFACWCDRYPGRDRPVVRRREDVGTYVVTDGRASIEVVSMALSNTL